MCVSHFEELLKKLNAEFRVDRELATSIIRKQDGLAREIGVKNYR